MAIIVPIIAKFVDEGLSTAKEKFAEANGSFAKTGVVLDSLAGPAKAVMVGMAGAGLSVAKNAGSAAKANKKLAASFEAVGYPQNAKAAMAYAESMQHVIGVSDEEIQSTMQKLAAFSEVAKSQETMGRATMAAADLSAAGFGTMDSAATQLGKALQDPTKNLGALTRMGVTFTKQQRKQIEAMVEAGDTAGAQAAILAEVESTVGGVAEASASGTDKMKLAWDEAAEAIGTALIPVLGILLKVLTKVANWVEDHATAFLVLGGLITGLAAAVVIANAAFHGYQLAMFLASKANKAFLKSMGWIGLIAAAIVALVVLIVKNWDTIKAATLAVWNWISGFLSGLWDKIKQVATTVWNGIKAVIKGAWEFIKRIFNSNPFQAVLGFLNTLKGWIGSAWDWIKSKIKTVWDGIKSVFSSNPFQAIKAFLDDVEKWFGDTWDWIEGKVSAVWDFVSGIVGDIQRAYVKAKDAVASIPVVGRIAGRGVAPPGAAAVPHAVATEAFRQMVGGVPVPQAMTVASRGGGGGGLSITVNGALDPDAVGRQIKRLLENHDLRQGRTRGEARRVAW